MIVISSLTKSFGSKEVLKDVNFVFETGVTSLMGASGSGKTTLLNIIMGLTPADSGTVGGTDGCKINAVFQEDRLCENLNAVKNVALVTDKSRAEIVELLEELGLAGSLDQTVATLSGGMRRRVCIARAIIDDAGIYILDEAFKGLDGEIKSGVIKSILKRTAGKTVISVTHDESEATALGGQTVRL